MNLLRAVHAFFVDTIQTILLAAGIFFIVYFFILRPFQVSGLSMYPTLHDSEHVFTNIIGLRFGDPKRGDIVVFHAPGEQDRDFIKRVIGLPGEKVSLNDGFVYINNKRLDEHAYLDPSILTKYGKFLSVGKQITVPPNDYFVIGDNREASSDSRDWGLLKKKEIKGVAFFVYLPLQRMRILKNPFQE